MPQNTFVFDLDGTLALVEHRRSLVEGENKDWRAFFAACTKDEPNQPVIETLRALKAARYQVVIVSGRSDEVKVETLDWLIKYDVPFDGLYMRCAGDYTPDEELKRQWLKNFGAEKILGVFDDRPSVVRMWRDSGLFVFDCGNGKEF